MQETLRNTFGVATFQKDTVLYCISSWDVQKWLQKPMVPCLLHPSEVYYHRSLYVNRIRIRRDVELLFLVKTIKEERIFSALANLTGNSMAKYKPENLTTYASHLQKEGLDGWISSIRNEDSTEIYLRNHPDVIEVLDSRPLEYDWRNVRMDDLGHCIPKKWGTLYPLYTDMYRVHMHIPTRFKDLFKAYREACEEDEWNISAFYRMLTHAAVTYFDAPVRCNIRWDCSDFSHSL